MVAVATCFGIAIVYFESSIERVRHETGSMLSNGVPSTNLLTNARTSLRKLDGILDHAVLELLEKRPLDRVGIAAARREVGDVIATYRRLPFYPFEAELNQDIDVELERLDAVLEQLVSTLSAGDLQSAYELENGRWRLVSDRIDDKLRTLIGFNIQHVTDHALRIDYLRKRAALVGMGVGSLGMLVALAATLVAARAVRRQFELQEERAAELEMFSARVAHDVISPLTSVSLGLEIEREQLRDEATRAMNAKMLATLKRMGAIVDGLYEFARAGGRPLPGKRAPVPKLIAEVCDDARSAAEREHIELCCCQAPPCEVACAPGVFAVLVTNLVNNAIKFMGDSKVRRITVETHADDEQVRVVVRDTGPGLPAGFEALVFEPYVRAPSETHGLGLGLATVKRLTEGHGGRVGFARGDGTGTSFWFELPRAAPRA